MSHHTASCLHACVHSCFKRHAPWAIMCCPLLNLEPNSQHMDTNWLLTSTISAPVWPPGSPAREMFVPVAPYLHAALRRRGVAFSGQTGFSKTPLLGNAHRQGFTQSLNGNCHLFLNVNSDVMLLFSSLAVYLPT